MGGSCRQRRSPRRALEHPISRSFCVPESPLSRDDVSLSSPWLFIRLMLPLVWTAHVYFAANEGATWTFRFWLRWLQLWLRARPSHPAPSNGAASLPDVTGCSRLAGTFPGPPWIRPLLQGGHGDSGKGSQMSALHLLPCSLQCPLFCPCHSVALPKVPTLCLSPRGGCLQGWGGVLIWAGRRAERKKPVTAGGGVEWY